MHAFQGFKTILVQFVRLMQDNRQMQRVQVACGTAH